MALTDSLDELITSGAITPQLAMKVLQQVSRGYSSAEAAEDSCRGVVSLTSHWRTHS